MSRPRNRRARMPQGVVLAERRALERRLRRAVRRALEIDRDPPQRARLDWVGRLD